MNNAVKYEGKVLKLNKDSELSYVLLKEIETGKVIQTDAFTARLLEVGLNEGDEFQILIHECVEGKTVATIIKKELDGNFDI